MPLIEDAAEALGATYRRSCQPGAFGECAAFSFNGNKIITTSGGGMLVSHDRVVVERARHLSTQARDPAPHYEHSRGRLQLPPEQPARGRRPRPAPDAAREGGGAAAPSTSGIAPRSCQPGISFMPEATYGRSNGWLTCVRIWADAFGATREDVRLHLESRDIESRPGVEADAPAAGIRRMRGPAAAASRAELFLDGLCLPSGSSLSLRDQCRVISTIEEAHMRRAPAAASALRPAMAI